MYLTPEPFYPRDTTSDINLIESGVGPNRCVPSPGTEPRFLGWPTGNLVNYTGAVVPDHDVEINKPNFNYITAVSSTGRLNERKVRSNECTVQYCGFAEGFLDVALRCVG